MIEFLNCKKGNFMKIFEKMRDEYGKKKKGYAFLLFLSFIITFFLSVSFNSARIESIVHNIDYANYPIGYSAYRGMDSKEYKSVMNNKFTNLDYHFFYYGAKNPDTNIMYENLNVKVIGCQKNFETFPLPSAYSSTIVSSKLLEGESFDDLDIISQSNAMVMYSSQLKKIGYKPNDKIRMMGHDFVLKGVLEDNSDIKRNINEDIIQIFIPYTTYLSLFDSPYPNVETVIYTSNYTFDELDDNQNFISYYKVQDILQHTEDYIIQSSYITIGTTFVISCICTAIVQIILIKGRYNEIGIRRAIGASRDSIVFLFTKKSLYTILIGALMGFLTFLVVLFNVELILSHIYFTNFIMFNSNTTFLVLIIYIFLSYLSVLLPSILGTRINISTILVEER